MQRQDDDWVGSFVLWLVNRVALVCTAASRGGWVLRLGNCNLRRARSSCPTPAPQPGSRGSLSLTRMQDCPSCKEMNFSYRTECFRCRAARPEGMGAAPGSRRGYASDVSYRNNDRAMPRPGPGDRRQGDWDCRCGNYNFARRDTCNKCGSSKSEGAAGVWCCLCYFPTRRRFALPCSLSAACDDSRGVCYFMTPLCKNHQDRPAVVVAAVGDMGRTIVGTRLVTRPILPTAAVAATAPTGPLRRILLPRAAVVEGTQPRDRATGGTEGTIAPTVPLHRIPLLRAAAVVLAHSEGMARPQAVPVGGGTLPQDRATGGTEARRPPPRRTEAGAAVEVTKVVEEGATGEGSAAAVGNEAGAPRRVPTEQRCASAPVREGFALLVTIGRVRT